MTEDKQLTKGTIAFKDLLQIFANQGSFHVVFQTQHNEVQIPEYLKEEPFCNLKFSHLFAPPGESDLEINDKGIQQTLSFNGEDFFCFIPYGAFIGIGNPDAKVNPQELVVDKYPFQLIKGGKNE